MQESINTPSVSREHFLTTVKGLRQTGAGEALDEALLGLPSFRLRSGSDRIPLGEFHELIAGIRHPRTSLYQTGHLHLNL